MIAGIIFVIFLAWHGINIFIAWQNKQIVQKRIDHKDLTQIEHFWWGFGYLLICLPFYWVFNLWFALALIPLHLSIFPVAYNDYRGLTPFNLSKTSKAITDKIMVRLGLQNTLLVNFGAEALSLILLFLSLKKLL